MNEEYLQGGLTYKDMCRYAFEELDAEEERLMEEYLDNTPEEAEMMDAFLSFCEKHQISHKEELDEVLKKEKDKFHFTSSSLAMHRTKSTSPKSSPLRLRGWWIWALLIILLSLALFWILNPEFSPENSVEDISTESPSVTPPSQINEPDTPLPNGNTTPSAPSKTPPPLDSKSASPSENESTIMAANEIQSLRTNPYPLQGNSEVFKSSSKRDTWKALYHSRQYSELIAEVDSLLPLLNPIDAATPLFYQALACVYEEKFQLAIEKLDLLINMNNYMARSFKGWARWYRSLIQIKTDKNQEEAKQTLKELYQDREGLDRSLRDKLEAWPEALD